MLLAPRRRERKRAWSSAAQSCPPCRAIRARNDLDTPAAAADSCTGGRGRRRILSETSLDLGRGRSGTFSACRPSSGRQERSPSIFFAEPEENGQEEEIAEAASANESRRTSLSQAQCRVRTLSTWWGEEPAEEEHARQRTSSEVSVLLTDYDAASGLATVRSIRWEKKASNPMASKSSVAMQAFALAEAGGGQADDGQAGTLSPLAALGAALAEAVRASSPSFDDAEADQSPRRWAPAPVSTAAAAGPSLMSTLPSLPEDGSGEMFEHAGVAYELFKVVFLGSRK